MIISRTYLFCSFATINRIRIGVIVRLLNNILFTFVLQLFADKIWFLNQGFDALHHFICRCGVAVFIIISIINIQKLRHIELRYSNICTKIIKE